MWVAGQIVKAFAEASIGGYFGYSGLGVVFDVGLSGFKHLLHLLLVLLHFTLGPTLEVLHVPLKSQLLFVHTPVPHLIRPRYLLAHLHHTPLPLLLIGLLQLLQLVLLHLLLLLLAQQIVQRTYLKSLLLYNTFDTSYWLWASIRAYFLSIYMSFIICLFLPV